MRGVTDLRRYLNKSDNPSIVSELDIERLGDPVSEPHADEAEEGWFDVPEENPILPDLLTRTQAPKIQSPVTATPTVLNIFRHQPYVPNHLPLPLQDISNGWFIQNQISNEVSVYRPTPKAEGQAQLFQPPKTPNSTAGAKFVKSVVTPGTPIQDEIVLHLDDTSSLDFLDEEPLELLAQKVCSGSTTTKGVDTEVQPTPAKKVRQSASPTRSLPKAPEERVETALPKVPDPGEHPKTNLGYGCRCRKDCDRSEPPYPVVGEAERLAAKSNHGRAPGERRHGQDAAKREPFISEKCF
ncbi:hypothetical protein DPMN_122454 [Dreissena polymorpha]|uniref:Uncharacterized protein n=1 Tax=Dreissena polymorpha TaxID=45954 RepID=A0A9D4GSL3_DREPO|nr:hypothetical protein DPMN_122454 [Dreissena polymorpha]